MLGVKLFTKLAICSEVMRAELERSIQEAELTHWIDASDAEINDDLERSPGATQCGER